ncbi:hypothetical protein PF004_g17170 [Phytophthora fragariae]|uniref:Myb/SANT-like domain-containing protein n=1 Tax=Phytophthora fragariae TaxID=53985 RepID=A0A6G0NG81_9STRA|nr:hypothetical protein PF004_g17170 [Phytophthora fragariae]
MSSDAEFDEANALSTTEKTAAPSTPTKRKRFVWSAGMIECLLSLRLGAMAFSFNGSRSVAQLSAAWERLRLKFALVQAVQIETAQLKNKYQALKKEFSTIKLAESDTGNKTNEPIVYPAYWDPLVQYIGDKSGLGSVNFGQSVHSDSSKRKAEVDAEIERQREQRRKKENVDIGQGLVLLGENLAKALVQRQVPQPVLAPTLLAELASKQYAMLQLIESNQQQVAAHIESAAAVNAALLSFLSKEH